jgi:TRAP-type C4-dicarboxylate transport system permease small subunit
MELKEFFVWLVSGGGAGLVAYWLIGVIPWLEDMAPEPKRYVALALTGLLAAGAFAVTVVLGYQSVPGTWLAWVEQIFSVIAVAIGLSQAIHARRVLRHHFDLPGDVF